MRKSFFEANEFQDSLSEVYILHVAASFSTSKFTPLTLFFLPSSYAICNGKYDCFFALNGVDWQAKLHFFKTSHSVNCFLTCIQYL